MQRIVFCLLVACSAAGAHATGLVRTDATAKWYGENIIINSQLHTQPTTPPPVSASFLRTPQTLCASTLFALNSFQVLPGRELRTLMASLAALPPSQVRVVGYTDATGSARNNMTLSRKRAQAVATALRLAAPQHRYETDGKGEANPIASNQTRAGRASNRRVTVEVVRAL